MQVSNLSKTINLFIVGSFFLINIIFIDQIYHLKILSSLSLTIDDSLNDFQKFILGIVFISILIFIGILIESISEIVRMLFRRYLKDKYKQALCKLFWLDYYYYYYYYARYKGWQTEFLNKITKDQTYKDIPPAYRKDIPITLILNESKELYANWVLNHYITYMLVSNYIIILFINCFILIITTKITINFIFLSIVMVIMSMRLGMGMYIYAYSLTYRFATIHEKDKKATTNKAQASMLLN